MKTLHTIYNNFAKTNLASLRLMLVMLLTLMVSANAWGETETITLSDFGWSNATVQSSITATSATISLAKNSAGTAPTYYTSGGLRIYGVKSATNGGTISFTPKKGITISKIVFTHTSENSGVLAIKTGTGSYSSKTWSGTLTEGNSVSLVSTNNTNSNPQVRITQIVITYTKAAAQTYNVTLSRNGVTETINDVEEGTALDDIDGTGDQGGCSPEWVFEGWSKTQRPAQNNTAVMDLVTTVDGAGPYYAVYSHTDEGVGGSTTVAMSSFSAVSGNVNNDANVSYEAAKGSAGTAPAVNDNQIRIYQNGGTLTITGNNDKTLTSITIGSAMKTSVSYKIDGGTESSDQSIAANGKFTLSEIEASSVLFTCKGTDKNSRLYLNYLSVTYSGGNSVYYTTSPSCTTESTITLNPNGGTPNEVKEYTTEETSYTLPACPFTRTGYNFAGWATSANGNAMYTDKQTLTGLNSTAINLYAKWEPIEYTITYNDTKDAANANPTTYTIEDEITFAALTNLPKGYNFTGWDPASIAKGTTGNQTVTAHWTEKALTGYRTDCDACMSLEGFASISGTYHFFPGETITLTVTPPADAVPYTYQWQKLVGSDWTDIAGATTTTYTKDAATIADAGNYRCVVSSEVYCDAIADYDVKCLQLYVYYDNKSDVFNAPLKKGEGTTATINIEFQNANYTYYFKITDGCGNWYGFNGDIHSEWCTDVEMNADAYCGLKTTKFGTYVFNVNYSDLTKLKVSIIYPSAHQAAGKVIYLDNNVLNWTNSNNADGKNKIYYRIGHSDHNSKHAMTLVPGTANLYKVTTGKYDNFDVWHIANNGCWSDGNSIYKTKTGDDWAATQATAFETLPVTLAAVTVTPTTLRSKGGDDNNNNCDFYNYDITEGMKMWNAKIIEPTNGTITVQYIHHDETEVKDFTAGDRDLAHTCLLTITATANEGYSLASLTVNDVPFTSGDVYTLTEDAEIKATFTINTHTVTWKPAEGNWNGNAGNIVKTYEYGELIEAPEKPVRNGYEFVEWTPKYTSGMTMPDEDVVFTAQWRALPTYTVTWMVNGEPITPTGDNMFTTEITSGNSIQALPDVPAAPAGCSTKVFVGWTTEVIDTETDTPPSKLCKVLADFPPVTANVTYHAVWADEIPGSGSGAKVGTVLWAEKFNHFETKKPSDAGIGAGTTIYGEASITYNQSNNNTKAYNENYAKGESPELLLSKENGSWYIYNVPVAGAQEMSLSFKSNKTTFSVSVSPNNDIKVSGSNCEWLLTNSNVSLENCTITIKNTSNSANARIDDVLLEVTVAGTLSSTTYTAYTTLCDNTKATVNYDLNGGTGAICESQKVTKGVEFTLCNQTPTKTGYNFTGWSDGTKTYAAGATVTVDDNTTFYASWTAKNITITWDQNYTDCPEATTSNYIYDGEEIAMPTDPTRAGYKFTGWFTAPTDGTQVTEVGETNKPTADVTYYAHWAELYTVTFMASGQVYVVQEDKYLSGANLELPDAPSAANYACDGYIFEGWTETEKATEDATKPTLISTPAITNDVTYYAVWKKATTSGAGETIFYESFDDTEGTGGNDGKWSGSIATSDAYVDNDGWDGDNFFGAYKCMKLGSGSKKGYVITPALTNLSGNATLSFKAAAWNASGEKTTLVLSIEGGGSLSQTSVTLTKGAWKDYEVTITGGTSSTRITFAGFQASDSRFFLDEVKVATSGSYNYTTSPSCGPTIVAKEGMWVTSSNAQSVKVNVPIAVKSFANNATITGTCANENFVVTQLDNVGNGEHNVVVTYTPNAFDTKEDATITLTAKNGDETLTTTTFTLNGRSLPETFAVVVDKASTYYALPANMPEAGVYPGFNVSLNGDKSAVVAAPKTHLYALKAVHKDRFGVNGTAVRFVGNNGACLWASDATNNTSIRNWASADSSDDQYEWNIYTEDGEIYTIACTAVTEDNRRLRMYGSNFGMYKSGADVFRFLEVECTEQPTNVMVSAARVTATIAWTNVAACKVDVYLKSNSTLVKSVASTASPVLIDGLAETTEYTFTITPVDAAECALSGEFKTTGPDIDIVEWMTDGIIIQVDKDENVNPKVVIKGEVEHNTGSGVMATELFFSKYFEAHGENKLLAIYNGTGAPIDLSGYEIKSENGALDLSQFGQTKGTVAPNEEIILVYYDVTDSNEDDIPDHSAEPCAQEQEGYEKWHKLANKSVLAFSGRGSIGLYKDDVLIDVIGSTYSNDGSLTKIGKSSECGDEDVRLYVEGISVNDQSSFFCFNGDNIKTDEVETDYAISTNRCLLIRKNTVTSGENAVTNNKAEAGAACGDLSSTFVTLCSEWAGFRIGSGNSNDEEVKEATCDGLGYVGGFDYNKYYREFETLDDSKTLDQFNYKPEENLYKLTIDNVAQYSCLNIQVQINDPVNGTVLTEQTAQVPILVTAANTTTDALFSNIINGDLDASKTRCSTCDVVVLNGATLTKAEAATPNDVNQVRNVYVYPGGQLIVPETGNDYKVNSVSFRRVEDAVANAQLSSNLNITASSDKPVYVDVRVNAENWHWFTLPYDCDIEDVTWVDGTPAKYGVDWFLSTYDGEKRAATQSGGCWAEFHGTTLKAGVGYIVGIAGHPTKSKVKYELRFPMSKEVLAQEVAGTDKTVPVYAWGVDEDMRPTHKGWNLVGNPYLNYYQKDKLNTFNGLRLGGEYVLNTSTGYWEDSGEWNGVTQNCPYVVVPVDGGWSAYNQVLVSETDLLPFTSYFVQVGNPETENNGEKKDVMFDGDNRGRASIARRAPSSVNEPDEPVIVGVSLTNAKGESDKTSLVIDNKYTDDYEMNADFFKWFGDYYRYYTKPVLYTIGADKQQRAFNAINEEQAAQPISMGTYTAQNGEYTFSLDRRSDLSRVKEVWLHDATESAYINLMQEDYSFSTGKTDGSGRFTLAVTLHPKAPTDITEGRDGHSYVTSHQRMLYVNNLPQQAQVWVYDAVGKLLVNETTTAYQRAYHLGQAGVYFVRVKSQQRTETLQAVVE